MTTKLTDTTEMREAAEDLLAVLDRFGDWDDGCFYYHLMAAPELGGPMERLRNAIKRAQGK